MTATDRLREQLERDEGLRLTPYTDSRGFLTIGIGHNLSAKAISHNAALVIFEDDIVDVVRELQERLPWAESLDEVRQGALINLCFNIGPGFIAKNPHMIAALRDGRHAEAAAHLLDGPYKDQVGERAHRIAKQIETGEWQ